MKGRWRRTFFSITIKKIKNYGRKRISGAYAYHPLKSASAAGSLTVETAFVLPIFLFAMITIMYLIEILHFSENVQAALCEEAMDLSSYAYAGEKLGIEPGLGSMIEGKIFSITYVKSKVIERMGSEYINESPVESGTSGLSFLHSSVLDNDEMIDLVVTYKAKMPYDFFGIRHFIIADRARVRAFTGYDNIRSGTRSTGEQMVFITEHGTVYHTSRSCRHLNFNIQTVDSDAVCNERSNDGSKYYPCEYCASHGAGETVYITDDGNRYHNSLTCPSLSRAIKEIPLSQAGTRSCCTDCGK